MTHAPSEAVHHLLTAHEWTEAESRGHLHPTSLDTEGFVHCSTSSQLAATVARHFPDTDDLLVATLDADRIGFVWERSGDHGVFPHVYGPIPLDAVVAVEPWPRP